MKKVMALLLSVSAMCLAGWAGETRKWAGGSGNWNNPVHWIGETVPQNGDSVIFTAEEGPITVENDIDGLELVKLSIEAADPASVAPIVLTGKKLTFTETGTAWDAQSAFTNAMSLVFAHNATPNKTSTVVAAKGGVFLGDIELDGDCSIGAGANNNDALATWIYGKVTGENAFLYSPKDNGAVHFYGPVKVKGILSPNWVSYYLYFHSIGNEWQTNDLSYSSRIISKAANAFPTNMVMRWTERRTDHGVEKGSYEPYGAQTIDRIESAQIKDRTSPGGAICDKFHVGYESDWVGSMILRLRATASASCAAKIWPRISIDYDPVGDFTQTFRDREHRTDGTLTVRRGTLESLGGNTFKYVTGLEIYGAATFKVSADENGVAANPFNTSTPAVIHFGGVIDVVADVTVTLKSLTANGVAVPVGIYQGADGTNAEATEVPWIRGAGLVQVLSAEDATCWKLPVSGAWDDAANWTAGVPTVGKKTYVTADGADYTVTVPTGTVLPKDLTIRNDVGTSTVKVDGDYTMTDWNWAVARGGEFRVSGGSFSFANNSSSSVSFEISGEGSQTGRVTVTAGTLAYSPSKGSGTLKLKTGGLIDVRGGVFDLPTLSANAVLEIMSQQGGTVLVSGGEFRNMGERYGWRTFADEATRIFGTAILSVKEGMDLTVMPTAAGKTARLAFSDAARIGEGCASIFRVGGCVGGRAVLDFDSAAIQGGSYEGGIYVTRKMMVGCNDGIGEMNVTAGLVPFYDGGIGVGTSDSSTKGTSGVKGILRVSAGALYVRATDNFTGWNLDRVSGTVVGYGACTTVREGRPYEGELDLSGGSITNGYGATIVGMGYATGKIFVSGGEYRVQSLSLLPTIVGMGGGRGTIAVSGGLFVSPGRSVPVYVGGCGIDVFGAKCPDLVATGYPIDRHDAEGLLSFSGGTLSLAGAVVLGADGQGVLERVGAAGTISVGADLVFSNTVENAQSGGTLKFVLDENGAVSPIAVGGKLVIDSHAKLVVDTGDTGHEKIKCALVDAKGGIDGDFAEGAVTFIGKDAKDMKIYRRGTGVLAARKVCGLMLIVR